MAIRRLLLDTHAALFWWGGKHPIGRQAREAMEDPNTLVLVSAASAWEVATKYRLGKLGDIGDPVANFRRLIASNGFEELDVTVDHSLRAGLLPGRHGDPFDRLIAAQGILERAAVVTHDKELARLGCEGRW